MLICQKGNAECTGCMRCEENHIEIEEGDLVLIEKELCDDTDLLEWWNEKPLKIVDIDMWHDKGYIWVEGYDKKINIDCVVVVK